MSYTRSPRSAAMRMRALTSIPVAPTNSLRFSPTTRKPLHYLAIRTVLIQTLHIPLSE